MWIIDASEKRTKLSDRVLPHYSHGEEVFNMVSHIVGGALGIVALVMCIIFSALRGHGVGGILSAVAFGTSMIILYTMSSIYHGLSKNTGKKVLQIMDHCSIYLLIAGTYTPLLIVALSGKYPISAWVTFGIIWGLAATIITFNAIDLKKYERISMIAYIAMGWAIIICAPKVYSAIGRGGFLLLLFGGIAYTLGAVLYRMGVKIPYMHSVFHLFVLAGSICHVLMMILFVFA